MSRTGAAGAYLYNDSAVVTDVPVTLSCWFKAPNVTGNFALMTLGGRTSFERVMIQASGGISGDPIRAQVSTSTNTIRRAVSASGFSANTWHHAAGVFESVTTRSAFIDGGNKGTYVLSTIAGSFDATDVLWERGNGTAQTYAAGALIAECAVWNVALSDDEIAILGAGYSPMFVRPQALKNYFPCFGRRGATEGEEDWIGNNGLLDVSNPVVSDDRPRIIYPTRAGRIVAPAIVNAPSLSDLRAASITETTVQGTYDYAF